MRNYRTQAILALTIRAEPRLCRLLIVPRIFGTENRRTAHRGQTWHVAKAKKPFAVNPGPFDAGLTFPSFADHAEVIHDYPQTPPDRSRSLKTNLHNQR